MADAAGWYIAFLLAGKLTIPLRICFTAWYIAEKSGNFSSLEPCRA